MNATPHAPGVYINLETMTRREQVLAYANARGVGWAQAIVGLVNQALADGPNPWHASVRSCAEVNGITEEEAYTLIWGADK